MNYCSNSRSYYYPLLSDRNHHSHPPQRHCPICCDWAVSGERLVCAQWSAKRNGPVSTNFFTAGHYDWPGSTITGAVGASIADLHTICGIAFAKSIADAKWTNGGQFDRRSDWRCPAVSVDSTQSHQRSGITAWTVDFYMGRVQLYHWSRCLPTPDVCFQPEFLQLGSRSRNRLRHQSILILLLIFFLINLSLCLSTNL